VRRNPKTARIYFIRTFVALSHQKDVENTRKLEKENIVND